MAGKRVTRKSKSEVEIAEDIFNNPRIPARLHCITDSGEHYFVTQDIHAGVFRLWHQTEAGYVLIAQDDSPLSFDDLIPWR